MNRETCKAYCDEMRRIVASTPDPRVTAVIEPRCYLCKAPLPAGTEHITCEQCREHKPKWTK